MKLPCAAVGTPRFTGIAIDPVEPKNIWAGLEVDGARHSSDGGDPSIIFAASRYGYLYRSDTGGESWTKLRRELSEIAAVCWLSN
jgi:hypothetical protein